MHDILKKENLKIPKNRKEKYTKNEDGTFRRTLIQEEDVVLNLEEIDRMEKNANYMIEQANNDIDLANEKLDMCQKLRDLI